MRKLTVDAKTMMRHSTRMLCDMGMQEVALEDLHQLDPTVAIDRAFVDELIAMVERYEDAETPLR